MMDKPHTHRILYAAGPGNVIGTYSYWKLGADDPSQVYITLSGLFYDMCKKNGYKAYVIASCDTPGFIQDDNFIIRHRPIPLQQYKGLRHHVGQIFSAFQLLCSALWFRADIAVITSGTAHWFPMRLFRLFGIKIIPSIVCTLWHKYQEPNFVTKILQVLNRGFFKNTVLGILSMSHDITMQIAEMTKGQHRPVEHFLPIYRPQTFQHLRSPPLNDLPFRVFFAGRIEHDKGIFTLVEIARRFKNDKRNDVRIDVCGTGSQIKELNSAIVAADLADILVFHGYANRDQMQEMFSLAHVVIVPTTTDFVEGFNQVVAEAVLAGRPVISSSVCPAIYYLKGAVIEVPPNDTVKYGDAIIRLATDKELYKSTCNACIPLQAPFYQFERGWSAALERTLLLID